MATMHLLEDLSTKTAFCQNCLKSSIALGFKLFVCKGCHRSHYCSPACQKAHWKRVHKQDCQKTLGLVQSIPDGERPIFEAFDKWKQKAIIFLTLLGIRVVPDLRQWSQCVILLWCNYEPTKTVKIQLDLNPIILSTQEMLEVLPAVLAEQLSSQMNSNRTIKNVDYDAIAAIHMVFCIKGTSFFRVVPLLTEQRYDHLSKDARQTTQELIHLYNTDRFH